MQRKLNIAIILTFLFNSIMPMPTAMAAPIVLPKPGEMVNLSPKANPALIRGITINKENPFAFDFMIDQGNLALNQGDKAAANTLTKAEADRLIKYFFTSLALSEKDTWVNLSPYEKDRIIPSALGQTAMGSDLLAQDYVLKQLAASLIHPDSQLGKSFWSKVYAQAKAKYGNDVYVPVNTFNKVWIVADKAHVYEHQQTAWVVDGNLKVMMEDDYLAMSKNRNQRGDLPSAASSRHSSTTELSNNIYKEIILPALEKEVNQGSNFAPLRQVFYSMILATWFKKNLRQALLNQVYADKNSVKGVEGQIDNKIDAVYENYLKAYKKGVFNLIKEESVYNEAVTRKYFSGGIVREGMVLLPATANQAMASMKPNQVSRIAVVVLTPSAGIKKVDGGSIEVKDGHYLEVTVEGQRFVIDEDGKNSVTKLYKQVFSVQYDAENKVVLLYTFDKKKVWIFKERERVNSGLLYGPYDVENNQINPRFYQAYDHTMLILENKENRTFKVIYPGSGMPDIKSEWLKMDKGFKFPKVKEDGKGLKGVIIDGGDLREYEITVNLGNIVMKITREINIVDYNAIDFKILKDYLIVLTADRKVLLYTILDGYENSERIGPEHVRNFGGLVLDESLSWEGVDDIYLDQFKAKVYIGSKGNFIQYFKKVPGFIKEGRSYHLGEVSINNVTEIDKYRIFEVTGKNGPILYIFDNNIEEPLYDLVDYKSFHWKKYNDGRWVVAFIGNGGVLYLASSAMDKGSSGLFKNLLINGEILRVKNFNIERSGEFIRLKEGNGQELALNPFIDSGIPQLSVIPNQAMASVNKGDKINRVEVKVLTPSRGKKKVTGGSIEVRNDNYVEVIVDGQRFNIKGDDKNSVEILFNQVFYVQYDSVNTAVLLYTFKKDKVWIFKERKSKSGLLYGPYGVENDQINVRYYEGVYQQTMLIIENKVNNTFKIIFPRHMMPTDIESNWLWKKEGFKFPKVMKGGKGLKGVIIDEGVLSEYEITFNSGVVNVNITREIKIKNNDAIDFKILKDYLILLNRDKNVGIFRILNGAEDNSEIEERNVARVGNLVLDEGQDWEGIDDIYLNRSTVKVYIGSKGNFIQYFGHTTGSIARKGKSYNLGEVSINNVTEIDRYEIFEVTRENVSILYIFDKDSNQPVYEVVDYKSFQWKKYNDGGWVFAFIGNDKVFNLASSALRRDAGLINQLWENKKALRVMEFSIEKESVFIRLKDDSRRELALNPFADNGIPQLSEIPNQAMASKEENVIPVKLKPITEIVANLAMSSTKGIEQMQFPALPGMDEEDKEMVRKQAASLNIILRDYHFSGGLLVDLKKEMLRLNQIQSSETNATFARKMLSIWYFATALQAIKAKYLSVANPVRQKQAVLHRKKVFIRGVLEPLYNEVERISDELFKTLEENKDLLRQESYEAIDRVSNAQLKEALRWAQGMLDGNSSTLEINVDEFQTAKKMPTIQDLDDEKDSAQATPYGGIDLDASNMGMTIERDAQGGVKMTVDPAKIERVRREGLNEINPVIIQMTPLNPGDIRLLLGLDVQPKAMMMASS